MNRRTKFTIVLGVSATILLAWSATIENPYNAHLLEARGIRPYYWQYPVWFAVLGIVSTVAVRPWNSRHSFVGGLTAFVLYASMATFLFVVNMHTPPAHFYLFCVCLLMSQLSLFYSGYALARKKD